MFRSIFHKKHKKVKGAPDNATEKKAADCILDFTIDLIKQLGYTANHTKSLIFSPLSVYATLSLAGLGATGSTKEEICKVLRSPENRDNNKKFHEEVISILESVQNQPHECGGEVKLVNGVFVEKSLELNPSYLSQLVTIYKAEVMKTDFHNCTKAKDQINQWLSEQTNGRITQLFHNETDPGTTILLASSLYFVSRWQEEFSASRTKIETFFTGAEEIEVPMMNHEDVVPYFHNTSLHFESIVLPYIRDIFSIAIILPYPDRSLLLLTENLEAVHIKQIFEAKPVPVQYKVPHMKLSSSMSLKATLFTLGMEKAFCFADFSNMIEGVDSASVRDVRHAAELEIDEDGTKATDISAKKYRFRSIQLVENPLDFRVNRPYVILIRHQPTSTILFTAIVYKPI